ncbi:hypothetical protein SCALM49S_07366 [Streptomyces californicus]
MRARQVAAVSSEPPTVSRTAVSAVSRGAGPLSLVGDVHHGGHQSEVGPAPWWPWPGAPGPSPPSVRVAARVVRVASRGVEAVGGDLELPVAGDRPQPTAHEVVADRAPAKHLLQQFLGALRVVQPEGVGERRPMYSLVATPSKWALARTRRSCGSSTT